MNPRGPLPTLDITKPTLNKAKQRCESTYVGGEGRRDERNLRTQLIGLIEKDGKML